MAVKLIYTAMCVGIAETHIPNILDIANSWLFVHGLTSGK